MQRPRDLARLRLEIFRQDIETPHGYGHQGTDNCKKPEKAWHAGAFGGVW
jgi:hypothetical protein